MNNNLVHIEITNEESLLKACDILHDAKCDLQSIVFDKSSGTLEAKFEREFFEDTNLMNYTPKLFLFKKVTFPIAESLLSLRTIKSYEVRDKSSIGIYTFNECRFNKENWLFEFCEDMNIYISFNGNPQGSLTDLKLLDKNGSLYLYRWSTLKSK